MTLVNKKEPILLLLGDIIFLYISLWLMLLLRYLALPSEKVLDAHLLPFSILFIVWLVFFYIAGFYEKHTIFLRSKLPGTILRTLVINSLIAVLFFYLVPFFGIAPKTNLFIYLVVSFGLMLLWRLFIFPKLFFKKRKYAAIAIGSGEELKELKQEMNSNDRYGFSFVRVIDVQNIESIDFQSEVIDFAYREPVQLFVVDTRHEAVKPILPQLYNLIFNGVQFIDKHKVYESIFDKIPLSIINYSWFLENISSQSHIVYDSFKRMMDFLIAAVLGIFALIVTPFVMLAIWLEDRGGAFIKQERVGQGGKKVYIVKFRSMTRNEDRGGWPGESENKITKVGAFIRKSRVDELPQLWNVLKGDISLIGPRQDIVGNFERLREELPYYTIRTLVKPGLSGWAQIHQDIQPQSIEETKERLAYDLYYIKNRSFLLDFKIALKTINTILSRTGR